MEDVQIDIKNFVAKTFVEQVKFMCSHQSVDFLIPDPAESDLQGLESGIRFCAQFFRDCVQLRKRISIEEIGRCLDHMVSPTGLLLILSIEPVSLNLRADCIRSMSYLYEGPFLDEAISGTCHMWWDNLFTFCCFEDSYFLDNDRLLRVVVEVLEKNLRASTATCRRSACHGIGELVKFGYLPRGEAAILIGNWLANGEFFNGEDMSYALQCANGTQL